MLVSSRQGPCGAVGGWRYAAGLLGEDGGCDILGEFLHLSFGLVSGEGKCHLRSVSQSCVSALGWDDDISGVNLLEIYTGQTAKSVIPNDGLVYENDSKITAYTL